MWFSLFNFKNFVLAVCDVFPFGLPSTSFTDASCHVTNAWSQNFDSILNQGWGVVFFYAGYTGAGTRFVQIPPDFHTVAADRGKLHGKHIKKIVSDFGSDNAGAVVYIDNEGDPITRDLSIYYNAMFAELRVPGPGDCSPLRPGFYARQPNLTDLWKDNVDLITWQITGAPQSPVPFRQVGSNVQFDIVNYQVKSWKTSPEVTTIHVGEQGFLNYDGSLPTTPLTKTLTPVQGWDFDVSFVRDPRFPEANPRFSVVGDTMMRGFFMRHNTTMKVIKGEYPDEVSIDGEAVEPEAPLALPDSTQIFTLNKNSQVITSRLADDGSSWVPFGTLKSSTASTAAIELRRLRGLTATSLGKSDTQVFFITRSRNILAQRKLGDAEWTGPEPFANGELVHFFSNITSIASADATGVDVLFIDVNEKLHIASWAASAKWPGNLHSTPEQSKDPSILLTGTAITAVAPSPEHKLVFAIGRDLHLHTAVWSSRDSKWTSPAPIGGRTDRLFSHSKLSATSSSAKTVLVAAITNEGVPCVYFLMLNGGGSWVLAGDRKLFPRVRKPQGSTSPGASSVASAIQWNINPFGDISLAMDPSGGMTLSCAGTSPGSSAVLQRRINKPRDEWFRLINVVKPSELT